MPSKRAPLGVLLHVISSREGHCPTVGRPLVEDAWDDYLWWQTQDRKIFKRINTLIKDIERRGNKGIGKPETLKHGFEGSWSRRISDEHRLVYKNTEDEIRVAACRYHYGH